MLMMTEAHAPSMDGVVAAWLSGAESADGLANPAGPLFVGGIETEQALTDPVELLLTRCSSCTASRPGFCC